MSSQLRAGLPEERAIAGARFSYISNVIDAKTQKPLFTPYIIVDTPVKDRDGKAHTLRIGYIGFVPPQILVWDKANLQGKVTVDDTPPPPSATCRRCVNRCCLSGFV